MTTNEYHNDEGGESACFVHLVCTDCGVVAGESNHQQWCAYVGLGSQRDAGSDLEPNPSACSHDVLSNPGE